MTGVDGLHGHCLQPVRNDYSGSIALVQVRWLEWLLSGSYLLIIGVLVSDAAEAGIKV